MFQHAEGGGLARIYQAAGDLIVYRGTEPYRWAVWPEPAVPPTVDQARRQPSELLRAANALVGFTGRHSLLAELARWRDAEQTEQAGRSGRDVAVRLIHGPGGQGKTRLAGQVARLWRQQGWVVLAAHHRRDRSGEDAFEVPVFDGAAGVLVVVDYAERWDTADLLTLLDDTCLPGELPVRVLLLARPAGTWWDSVKWRIQRDLGLVPTRRELEPLEQEPGITRAGLFAAARDRFADLLQVPAAEVPAPAALERHEAYRLVLTVHMAALAAVLAADRGQEAPGDPVQVSELLLARERDHWEAMASPRREKPLATSPEAMAQLVYTATLTGRLGYDDGKAAVARARIESNQAIGQLLKDHALCYPPTPASPPRPAPSNTAPNPQVGVTVLEPLYPDRLGEDFIALSTPGHSYDFPADPWTQGTPARLLATDGDRSGEDGQVPVWARHALTTLIEAARRWPHLAHQQVYPLLADAPHLAVHAGGAALAALADLDDVDLGLLEAIEAILPTHRHIDLDVGAAAIASRLAEARLAATTDPVTRARIHDALAARLSYAGLHERALTEGHQALQLWRRLAALDRDAHLPGLASSLNNHANRLAEVGRREDAVPVSEEAVRLYRELVELNRDAHVADLAASLTNQVIRLVQVGRWADAVPVSQEAVDLYRGLVELNRDAHLPNLAASVNNHANLLAGIGRREDAVPVSEEAVRLRRELVELNRDAYLPDLAASLSNHANRLAGIGRGDEAVPVSEEAVGLYRELVELNRDAHLPNLAMAVNNHAIRLAEVGRRNDAVPVSEEAVGLYRGLVERNRDAHLPDYVQSVVARAYVLVEDSRFRAAVPLLIEASTAAKGLPEYLAQPIIGAVAGLLRRAYAGDATAVADEFRRVTGQDVSDWLKDLPSAPAGEGE